MSSSYNKQFKSEGYYGDERFRRTQNICSGLETTMDISGLKGKALKSATKLEHMTLMR